jgi:hypothetical protein
VKRISIAALAAMAVSASAHAGWDITGDIERFRWSESTAPRVTETGPMFGIGGRFTQEREAGWQFGWRGRLYFGSVDYRGSFLADNTPASGTTEYAGLLNEGRAVYRLPGNRFGMELVSGLILDIWNRRLSEFQQEDYWVASLRLGVNFDQRRPTGWFAGGGIKYPFYAREDAHLTDIGFNSNPKLEPKGALSLYADAGYRFNRKWSMTGYYDSYRFDESEPTTPLVNPFLPGCSAPSGCRVFQPTSRVDSLGLRLQYSFQ